MFNAEMNEDIISHMSEEDKTNMEKAGRENAAGIKGSAFFVQFFNQSMLKQTICAMQLGMAIMMDKPIIVLAEDLDRIPKNLRKIAVVVDYVDFKNPELMQRQVDDAVSRAETLLEWPKR